MAATAAIVQRKLTTDAASLVVRNTGPTVLYPRLVLSGLPAVGQEVPASNGLRMEIEYLSPQDVAIDATRLEQGTDFKARVKLTNTGVRGELRQVALSHLFPSGWELHNERMDAAMPRADAPFAYQDFRDDRVYTYLDLKAGETKTVEVRLNASYLGHFYAPLVSAEAMYDATLNARTKGQWVRVAQPGKE